MGRRGDTARVVFLILPNLNLLLYAYNSSVAQHQNSREWWELALNSEELIALPHEVVFGFVRIATNPRLGDAAISLDQANSVVSSWLKLPQVRVRTPTAGHFSRVMNLMKKAQARGTLLSDAILAAYAIENRACLCTNDTDFARFPELEWINPLRN